ncbi:MAG: mechanosensitive ion channel family protein [Myxococcales bacterium]|nr:mechanosensitive ion channel family protein [Myxococcales bacterium]
MFSPLVPLLALTVLISGTTPPPAAAATTTTAESAAPVVLQKRPAASTAAPTSARAWGRPPQDCSSPRLAAQTIFGWLRPSFRNPEKAAHCFALTSGNEALAKAKLAQHAVQLQSLIESKNIPIDLEAFPSEENYVDAQGRSRVELHHELLPSVWLRRTGDGSWRLTPRSLDQIDVLYKNAHTLFSKEDLDKLPAFLHLTAFGITLWQYIGLTLLILLGMALRKLLFLVLNNRLERFVARFGKELVVRFIDAIVSPLATLLVTLLLAIAYPQLRLPAIADTLLAFIIHVLIVFSCVWALYRLVDVFCDRLAFRASKTDSKLDDQLVPLIRRVLKIAIVAIGLLFILQNLNVDIGSLLAGLGIGGIAIAMAAKETLANFFGSIVIFSDKPFQVGDWVVVDGAEGVIEVVGFRSTRVRTFYDSIITVPNSKVADAKIDNYGARRYRRVTATLGLSFDTTPEQIQAFVEGIRAILQANEFARKDYYEIHLAGFSPYAFEIMLYFFLKCPDWTIELRERHNIYLEIIRLAKALQLTFAYPTQRLHHELVATPGAPRAIAPPLDDERMGKIVNAFAPNGELARPNGPYIAGGWPAWPQGATSAPTEPDAPPMSPKIEKAG